MRPLGVHDGMRSHRHTNGSVYIPTRSIHSAMFLKCTLNFSGSRDQKQSVVRRRFQNVRPTPSLATQGSYGANSAAKVVQIERKTKLIWIFPRCSLPSTKSKVRISEQISKFYLRYFEREYLHSLLRPFKSNAASCKSSINPNPFFIRMGFNLFTKPLLFSKRRGLT